MSGVMKIEKNQSMVPLEIVEPEPVKTRSKLRIFAIIAALFSTVFLASLNQTIMATAVPTISSDLHSASGYSWVGGAYLLAQATAAPIWAKLSDIWGRKPILMTVVALYFASSIVCAMAKSMEMLIIGRAFQGTAGGGLIQLVYITISDLFSMRSRTFYLGLLQLMWTIAGGVGPVLGGALTQYASWRWIFWINLPISCLTFLLLMIFLDVHNPKTKFGDGVKAIDWCGGFSILGLMVMLLLGLNFGGVIMPWNSATVICLIIFGLVMSVFFVVSESRLARYPIMPMDLFRHKSNVACLVVGFMHDFALLTTEYYLPLFFQSVKEASPSRSGVLILPITLTQALMGIIAGMIIHRTGHYIELLWGGVIFLTLGTGLYIHLSPSSSIGEIIGFEFIAAIGAGLLFSPPLIALQAMVSQARTSTATATLGFVRNLATVLAVVIGGVIFSNGMDRQIPKLIASGLPQNITNMLSGNDAMANVNVVSLIVDEGQKLVVKEAFALSLRNLWIMCACMAGVGMAASVFISQKSLSKEHKETKTGLGNENEG